MKEKILQILQNKNNISAGHCGISIPDLIQALNSNKNDVQQALAELFYQQKITVRQGLNSKLFFINNLKNDETNGNKKQDKYE